MSDATSSGTTPLRGYLLDTDTASDFLRGRGESADALRGRIRAAAADLCTFHLCVVTFQEQVRGMLGKVKRANSEEAAVAAYAGLDEVRQLYGRLPVLPYDAAAADAFAACGAVVAGDEAAAKALRRVGERDRRIAAIAVAKGLVVLTRNTRDFDRIPGVTHEDWTAPLDPPA